MRPFERFSPYEFEGIVGDLLGTDRAVTYERFRRGPDLGIDLRRYGADGELEVVQCKHYLGSSLSQLRGAARAEHKRLERLDPAPSSYWFVTSQQLSPQNKSALLEDLVPWIDRPDHILGANDLEALLDSHPEVERRHVKMWLPGGTALAALLRAGTYHRSRALVTDIELDLHLYVQTNALRDAREILHREGLCLVSGPPGIGKTTLARMLLAESIHDGWEPIEISHDVSEAWDVLDPEVRQVFYYDDFLGTTTLGELEKNEDRRLISLIEQISKSGNARFLLTTREYILQQASGLYETFRRADLPHRRFLLTLEGYSRFDRALILHNHLYHSSLAPSVLEGIGDEQRYERIIDHRNFNPRLIELIVGQAIAGRELKDGEEFVARAEAVLENPTELWRTAFERQLDPAQQGILLVLLSMPSQAQLGDLETAHASYCRQQGIPVRTGLFADCLRVADDTFTSSSRPEDQILITFANPSIEDFVRSQLTPGLIESLLRSSSFFEQFQQVMRLADQADAPIDRGLVTATAIRLFDSETAEWIIHRHWDDRETRERYRRGPEIRLSHLIDLVRHGQATEELIPWVERQLESMVGVWATGDGDAWRLVDLATKLVVDEPPRAPTGWKSAIKTALINGAVQPELYRELVSYRELCPEAFTSADWSDVQSSFMSEAHDDLKWNASEFSSEDVVDEYLLAAEELGLELDSRLVNAAREEISQRIADREPDDEYDPDLWRDRVRDRESEAAEIDDLFRRLARD